jgi:predicted TIM-barrel fold metal-dependent hydrolase
MALSAQPASAGLPISADSHVVEAPEVFAGLAQRFGDEGPRIASVDGQVDAMVIPARSVRAVPAGELGIAGRRLDPGRRIERRPGHKPSPEDKGDPYIQEIVRRGYAGLREGLLRGGARAADQDQDGIRAEVLYPSIFFSIFGLDNIDLVVACFRNYNDWMADYCRPAGERLVGLALIPLHDPAAGAKEIERALRMGFRGGCIPCTAPVQRPYRDPAYERVWAAAEEADFPLSMHAGTNGPRRRPIGANPGFDYLIAYAGAAVSIQQTLAELLCQGVAHRHPRLKFVVAEFNTGWIAHWLDRLDQAVRRTPEAAADCLDLLPSEYWRRQFFATFEDDRAGVLTRELVGVNNLMWANDYPHLDSTWPCSHQILDEILCDVPAGQRRIMTHDNAAALYRLADRGAETGQN